MPARRPSLHEPFGSSPDEHYACLEGLDGADQNTVAMMPSSKCSVYFLPPSLR